MNRVSTNDDKVSGFKKTIDAFAKKPENSDFKEMLTDYREMLELNRYAPMPEMLKKLSAMMENGGVSIEESWGVLNPGKVVKRLKGDIASAQKKKILKGGIPIRGKGKMPKLKNLAELPEMDTEAFMNAVVDNANARIDSDE